MNKYIFLFIALFSSSFLAAQQELGLHFMRDNWYARNTNPAFATSDQLVIGLPGLYNNSLIANLTYNDLVVEENGRRILDIDRGIDKLEDLNNIVRSNLVAETIQLGFKVNKLTFSFGHSVHFNAYLNYPKTLPQLIWQGNAQFIGQEIDFSTDAHFFGYNEFHLGVSAPITPNFHLGGRVKYLSGFEDISVERKRLSLYTDDDVYELLLNADLIVNSTGEINYKGFRDLQVDYNFGQFEGADIFTQNGGYAFDVGAHLKLGQLDISASLLDVGQINWESSVRNYTLSGDYEFKGLDLAQDILDNAEALGSVIDTLLESYEVIETARSYTTKLGAKTYLSAGYQLNDAIRLGALFYGEKYRDEYFSSFALGGTARLTSFLTAGAHYAVRNETYNNLGVNFQLHLGPVQLFAATDNIITAFRIKDSNSANVRVGLYLAFGDSADSAKSKDNPDSWF